MKIDNLKDMINVKKYDIIYADLPWSYKDKKNNDPRMGGITYDVMNLDDIKAMGDIIKKISAKDCSLFLWVTMPMLQEGLEVIKAWGFEYKTCAFTWVKLRPKALVGGSYGTEQGREENILKIQISDIYSGLGHWTNGNAELCLFAKKGHPKRLVKNIKQIVVAPRSRHSEKPIEVRNRIEKLLEGEYTSKNKLELFCRGTGGDTWDIWGNESEYKKL